MLSSRMPLALGRMNAHRLVLAALLLIALTSSALAAALAVFAGQTVPQAAQRNLATAPGTSVLVSGPLMAGQAATVTTALPAAALFRLITPGGAAPGLAIPGRPALVAMTASLGSASLRLAPATATLSVQDADGNVYALPAGTLNADGRMHILTAEITPSGKAIYPLRLLAVTLEYALLRAAARSAAVFAVRGVTASPAPSGGPGVPFGAGAALAAWTPTVSSPELTGLLQTPGATAGRSGPPQAGSWLAAAGSQALSFNPGYGQATPATGPALPIQGSSR